MLMRTELKPIKPWVGDDDVVAPEESRNLGWYILLVEPNGEGRSATRLRRFKMPTYWPSYSSLVVHRRGKRRLKQLAMIPGYLFLPVSPFRDDGWDIIHKQVDSIRGFLRDGYRMPAVLGANEMQDLMCAEARLNSPIPDAIQAHKFKVGDRVRYVGNVYWQWEGLIAALAKDGKAAIDGIPMLGSPTRIWVRASEIEAV